MEEQIWRRRAEGEEVNSRRRERMRGEKRARKAERRRESREEERTGESRERRREESEEERG